MKNQKAIGPKGEHERRGGQRVNEGLGVVEPAPNRIFPLHPTCKGKTTERLNADGLPALQEDPFRAGKLLPDADQVLALEGEVEIARQAVRQAVVGRLVAFEPAGALRKIDGQCNGQQHQRQPNRSHGADVQFRAIRHTTVTRNPGRQERQIRPQHAPPPRGARDRVEERVETLHLADERADVVLPAGHPRGGAEPCAFVGTINRPDDLPRQRLGIAPRDDHRIVRIGEDVEQTVRVGGDDRLSHRERFEGGDRRALPQRRKHAQVERRQRARHVALEAGEHEPIAEAEPRGLRLQVRQQRSFPDQEEAGGRPFADDPGGRLDQVGVALRLVEPGHRPNRELVRLDAELRPRRGDIGGRPDRSELFERHAQIHDLHFRRRDLTRADHEIGRALRDGDGDVGVGLEEAVGDLLKPGRVGEVGVLVQDRRNPPPRRRHPAERRGAVPVQMEHIDLLAIDDVEQRRQGHRVELRPLQVGDVDAQLLQRLLREVFLAKAHERDVEPFAIEPRDHPREQALDAVHPRSFPAKVIADLQHVERSICHAREAADPAAELRNPVFKRRGRRGRGGISHNDLCVLCVLCGAKGGRFDSVTRSGCGNSLAIISCLDSILGLPYHRALPRRIHRGWAPSFFTAVTRFG